MIKKLTVFLFPSLLLVLGFAAGTAYADSGVRFTFKKGDMRRVSITEILRLSLHSPQVDEEAQKPSVRTTNYSFTYTFDEVYPDGSALVGATLDSFRTLITIGEGRGAEEFFRFNSTDEYDLKHNFRDIKTLPRAQFLGQTLKFVMYPDGTIHDFKNLDDFHKNAIGKGYDYDMVHAMLSLTDSLRMGQLLEFGFGGAAAIGRPYSSPSTVTEIPLSRTVTATQKGDRVELTVVYTNPPAKVEYLEGIATPLGLEQFKASGRGSFTVKNGLLSHGMFHDSASVDLHVDVEVYPEQISRDVTMDVYPVETIKGGKVSIRETELHTGVPVDPAAREIEEMEKREAAQKPSGQKSAQDPSGTTPPATPQTAK